MTSKPEFKLSHEQFSVLVNLALDYVLEKPELKPFVLDVWQSYLALQEYEFYLSGGADTSVFETIGETRGQFTEQHPDIEFPFPNPNLWIAQAEASIEEESM